MKHKKTTELGTWPREDRNKPHLASTETTQCTKYEYPSIGTELILGDALGVVSKMEMCSVDLIVTSPPYNIGKEYEKKSNFKEYFDFHDVLIAELVRILKPGGSICWQVGNSIGNGEILPLDILFYPLFKSRGLLLRNRIVWTFGHGLHAKKRFSGRHETILWFTKGDGYSFNLDAVRIPSKYPQKKHYKGPNKGTLSGNPLGKNPGDVWDITNVKALHPEKTKHPCQFPVALIDRIVKGLSKPNDLVLDPFAGSGTTLIAAAMNFRRSIGIEISKKYVEIAQVRIEEFIENSKRSVINIEESKNFHVKQGMGEKNNETRAN